jgi:hypothetical protein
MSNRYDYVFSYWIFAWYLLYITRIFTVYNPKFALIVALFENICVLFLMLYYRTEKRLLILFLIVFFIIKVIPLYTIWHTEIKKEDIYASIVLLILYLIWAFINKQSVSKDVWDLVLHNKNNLPGMTLLAQIFK